MNHSPDDQSLEELTLYVLDELEPEQRAAFEARLAEDVTLRQELEQLQGTIRRVQEEVPPAPEWLSSDRLAQLQATARGQASTPRLLRGGRPLAAAAVLMLAVAGTWALMRPSDGPMDATHANANDPTQVAAGDAGRVDAGSNEARHQSSRQRIGANTFDAVDPEEPNVVQLQASGRVDPLATDHSGAHAATTRYDALPSDLAKAVDQPVVEAMDLTMSTGAGGQNALRPAEIASLKAQGYLAKSSTESKTRLGQLRSLGYLGPTATTKDEAARASLEALGYTLETSSGNAEGAASASAPVGDAANSAYSLQRPKSAAPRDEARGAKNDAFGVDAKPIPVPTTATDAGDDGEKTLGEEVWKGTLRHGVYGGVEKRLPTVEQVLESLARRPGETPDAMYFRFWGDNAFVDTGKDPLATLAMDVDTASYTLARGYLSRGNLPPRAAVRTEEFLNTFDHGLTPPTDGSTFAIHQELSDSPFGPEGCKLLRIGFKAKEVAPEARPPLSLTFVIDVSGSMKRENRLALVQRSLHLLVDQLDERDTLGLVSFSTNARRILEPHSLEHESVIRAAIDSLVANGSTNAADGLTEGYKMALGQYRDEAQNRVILCSDGVANTGATDVETILAQVSKYREDEIFLNSIGVGMGNHNDALLEQLADRGDGMCTYVDRIEEARRVFVDDLTGSLVTVAADAKIQVEFDPKSVRCWRQIGYENRVVADQDFRNDKVDAGEVGAGHEVIALFELELVAGAEAPFGQVRLRYRDVDSEQVIELNQELTTVTPAPASTDFRLCASVAEFAELLRRSSHAADSDLAAVLALAEPLVDELDQDPTVVEFVALLRHAKSLPGLFPARTEWTRTLDAVKRNRWLQAEVENLEQAEASEMLAQIEQQNRQLEQHLRELLKR